MGTVRAGAITNAFTQNFNECNTPLHHAALGVVVQNTVRLKVFSIK